MRVVSDKLEYIISCPCKLTIAYVTLEMGRLGQCPKCGLQHRLDGSHPTALLSPVNVHYSTEYGKKQKKFNFEEKNIPILTKE